MLAGSGIAGKADWKQTEKLKQNIGAKKQAVLFGKEQPVFYQTTTSKMHFSPA